MDESKTEEMKFVKQISSMFKERARAASQPHEEKSVAVEKARAIAEPHGEKAVEKQIYQQIKKLESEHKSKIDINMSRIQSLRHSQEKLKIAIDILRELELSVPPEFNTRLNSYPQEIKNLEVEVDREKIFLNYLHTRIMPLIEK